MDPRELKSNAEWLEVLEALSNETSLEATLTDDNGKILIEVGQRFPICIKIRKHPEALTYICSQSSAAMLAVAKKTLRPVVDECDAGLLRLAIPVVSDGALVGQVVACGLRGDDVDTFLISKQTGISEGDLELLVEQSKLGSEEALTELGARFMEQINPQ